MGGQPQIQQQKQWAQQMNVHMTQMFALKMINRNCICLFAYLKQMSYVSWRLIEVRRVLFFI